jgi:hypothetical protein
MNQGPVGAQARRGGRAGKRPRAPSRRRAATFAKRIVRVAVVVCVVCALGCGSLALVASCSSASTPRAGSATDAALADRSDMGAAASCPLPSPDPDRCSGDDPGFVFFPPLACDPSRREAAASEAAVDGGDRGDPCDGLVNTLSVFFTPQACRAFVAAEASGGVASDTSPDAPLITEPYDGDMLTSDAWSIFFWEQLPRDTRRGPIERALDLVEPSAHAYSPLGGDAYVLEFSQGCIEVMRVMVTSTYWEPDAVSWNTLSSLTGPVRVTVYWMRFTADGLASVPVPSPPITITMQNTGE